MMVHDYDYIVIGGGTAGCVTAYRLVSDHGAHVLLIEAGPRRMSPIMHMPAGYMKYLSKDTYLTMHKMESQPQLAGRATIVPQARVLGGGSSVNAMVYMRGQAADYDIWDAELGGNSGWDFKSLLPHFKRLESNAALGEPFHGKSGRLEVTSPNHICAMTTAFIEAAQSVGLDHNPDFNGDRQLGVGLMQYTIGRNRRRCSTVDAFLNPILRSPSLTLMTGASVQRVIIEGKRATGVEILHYGETITARAGNEVILTAGAYITPKLLMLSGIGPADHLRQHGISVVSDSPGVGANLQDHCEAPVINASNGKYGYFGEDRGWRMVRNGLQYLLFKSGPVTTIGVEACAFINPDNDGATQSSRSIVCRVFTLIATFPASSPATVSR
jgi:choline dehydrogenase